ncbi:MAG: biotin/lipoyl-binding protein [Gemmatimonadetes bacterium]|nr:biotin/lipoyl-binding protein [Gemmatimonadota bacterium]
MLNFRRIAILSAGALACGRTTPNSIEATGTLEVTEIRVSATVPARVMRVLAEEGAQVRAGDTLAILAQPTLEAEERQRTARARAARANVADMESGARADELRRAESELAAAESEAARA